MMCGVLGNSRVKGKAPTNIEMLHLPHLSTFLRLRCGSSVRSRARSGGRHLGHGGVVALDVGSPQSRTNWKEQSVTGKLKDEGTKRTCVGEGEEDGGERNEFEERSNGPKTVRVSLSRNNPSRIAKILGV